MDLEHGRNDDLNKMSGKKVIKKLLNYVLLGFAAIFISSLIFVPLHYFSLYGDWLISIFVVVFIVSIVVDLFYFSKETPQRKWGKPKKEYTRRIETRAYS